MTPESTTQPAVIATFVPRGTPTPEWLAHYEARNAHHADIPLMAINRDRSIQCRAKIDADVVQSYAERMAEGDPFPPVILFGTSDRCYIGDGWHRIQAAEANDFKTISAILHPGGRSDALKHALGANATHGHRRSNADKRRSIEIALREFPKLSDRAIGKLCGVSDKTVATHRPTNCGHSAVEKRTGCDGKERPATRAPSKSHEAEAIGLIGEREIADVRAGKVGFKSTITAPPAPPITNDDGTPHTKTADAKLVEAIGITPEHFLRDQLHRVAVILEEELLLGRSEWLVALAEAHERGAKQLRERATSATK